MSMAIEGRFIFGTPEKEFFRRLMRKLETFCGVRIVTYSILSSHWHILLDVPERQDIDDKELIRRIRALYGKNTAKTIIDLNAVRAGLAQDPKNYR